MRKSLVVISLLFVIAFIGAIVCHILVSNEANSVELNEECLEGDVKNLEGMELSLDLNMYADHLNWNIMYPMGGDTKTDFDFRYNVENRETAISENRIDINPQFYIAASTTDKFEFSQEDYGRAAKMLNLTAEKTRAGDYHEEIFRVKEFMDTYPICVDIMLDGGERIAYEEITTGFSAEGDERIKDLVEFISEPVGEDDEVSIMVEKDPTGAIYSFNINPVEDGEKTGFDGGRIHSASGKDYFFIALEGEAYPKEKRGIYRLPTDSSKLGLENLEMIYQFKDGENLNEMLSRYDSGMLTLLFVENGEYILCTMDKNGKILSEKRTPYKYDENTWIEVIEEDEFVLLIRGEKDFVLYDLNEKGELREKFSHSFPEKTDEKNYDLARSISYDGERLAFSYYTRYVSDHEDIRVTAFDKSGLIYRGTIQNSMDRGRSKTYHLNYHHKDDPRIFWE